MLICSMSFFSGQIKIEIKPETRIMSSKILVELKIVNETNYKYVFPVNVTDLKPYFQTENCTNYADASFKETNDLFLRLVFLNPMDGSYVDKIFNNPDPSTLLHSSENNKKKFEKKKDSAIKSHKNIINQWIKKNNIKKNKDWAEINRTIFESLIYLKPQQTITYKIYIDPSKLYSSQMYETGNNFYSYYLENNIDYNFLLKYCVDSNIYQYLTEKQKNKIKGYKLFSGSLESNILKWKE
jgi:hypothetical protein